MTLLHIHDVSIELSKQPVIRQVSFDVPASQFTAIVGPNGAGKSTLLHAIASIEPVSNGHFALAGVDTHDLSRRQRARRIALVEQQTNTELEMTVRDAVLLGRTPHLGRFEAPSARDHELAEQALRKVNADQFADRLFNGLSGGEQQRVSMARALAQEPELLLMDEPTNHLDIGSAFMVLDLIDKLKSGGLTVLAALHDLNLAAAYADHVVVLSSGEVVAQGSPAHVFTPALLHEVYGVRASVIPHPVKPHPVIIYANS